MDQDALQFLVDFFSLQLSPEQHAVPVQKDDDGSQEIIFFRKPG